MSGKSNTEDFIKKAKIKHGDKYDYSKVEYIKAIEKVIIICREHGDFLQTPNNHLLGQGCSKCSGQYQPTTEEWIEKARNIHNNKYDYSKVDYKNARNKIIIICREHGEFEQPPDSHLRGSGCIKCGILSNSNKKRSNKEDFIKKAILIHGDTYDYSLVNYLNTDTKVIIICKEHRKFLQTPYNHLKGQGCKKCGTIRTSELKRSNVEEFIEKVKEIHEDRYDYLKVEYKNSQENVIIICKIHGEFKQLPSNHLKGQGCGKCVGKNKTTHDFIKESMKMHGDKYDYSKTEYISCNEKITIICKIHGEFLQTPTNHLNSSGCGKCFGTYQPTTEEWIEKARNIHGDKYDYSKVEYINCIEKVIIICKIHGEFKQTPNSHLNGCGCPFCVNKTEGKLYEKLQKTYPSTIAQFSPEWIGRKRFDFCIPEHNIIIELDGRQHFEQVRNWSSPEEQYINDKEKEELATEHNYCIIRLLQEDVFYDTYDWFGELLENIQILINEKPSIQNIYMDKNDEYEPFV